jgi:hypothetical protein
MPVLLYVQFPWYRKNASSLKTNGTESITSVVICGNKSGNTFTVDADQVSSSNTGDNSGSGHTLVFGSYRFTTATP